MARPLISISELKVRQVLLLWHPSWSTVNISPDGGAAETILTGKVFGSVNAGKKLSVYGEIAAAFDDVNSCGTESRSEVRPD